MCLLQVVCAQARQNFLVQVRHHYTGAALLKFFTACLYACVELLTLCALLPQDCVPRGVIEVAVQAPSFTPSCLAVLASLLKTGPDL